MMTKNEIIIKKKKFQIEKFKSLLISHAHITSNDHHSYNNITQDFRFSIEACVKFFFCFVFFEFIFFNQWTNSETISKPETDRQTEKN